jgi:hypothetical protein
MTRQPADVITMMPGVPRVAAPPVARAADSTPRAMSDAVAAMAEACERYAESYAKERRQPIGCDVVLGPTLLEVLRGMATLTSSDRLRDRIREIVSDHALDLEE